MNKDAQLVKVVVLFRRPPIPKKTWRLTLTGDDLVPLLYEILLQNLDGELDLYRVREEERHTLPDMCLMLQGMSAAAHELMGTLAATLLKCKPRLAAVNSNCCRRPSQFIWSTP